MPDPGLIVLVYCIDHSVRLNDGRKKPRLWIHNSHREIKMALSKIGQIAMQVSDADRAEKFYGEALGLHKLYRFGELVFFDCDGLRLMLEGTNKPVEPGHGICFYFVVKGLESVVDKLKSKSVVFEDDVHMVAKMSDHELWMTFFRDPDGHLLALMEEKR